MPKFLPFEAYIYSITLLGGYHSSKFKRVTQEAISTGDPELLKIVLTHRDSHMLQNQAKIITALLEKLKSTPDFYVEIKWEFTSRRCYKVVSVKRPVSQMCGGV
ncbi:Ankyrin repeat domain-containing protein 13D [Taenia solium]|eukprot:TsM_001150100 transcript=TsM_001150100 gene=TsM_001150100